MPAHLGRRRWRTDPPTLRLGLRLRLRRSRPSGSVAASQLLTEQDRDRAARQLARAQRDGRFASSDLYEQRMEVLLGARRRSDLDQVVGDLDDLVPARVRSRLLHLLARAHADGRLDYEQFSSRTDRCLEPLDHAGGDRLVADLGFRLTTPVRSRPAWVGTLRRVAVPAALGGAVGTALVAVPAGLDLPGGLSQWLPLAIGTGAFSAVGTGVATLAWLLRPPSRRTLSRS